MASPLAVPTVDLSALPAGRPKFALIKQQVEAALEKKAPSALTLHGQTRAIVLSVKQAGDRYTGTSTFKQTDFGIKPVSAGGGSVKVKDEVTVSFDIALK